MKKQILFILAGVILCLSTVSYAQNAAEVLQGLKKLNTVGSVLYIAAHPDDENTRLLSYLSSEKKLRTAYLSITRGDGGQNLIGKEQGELLGLIRTQELLAARRVDGAEQFFTRANDFGYSKSPEETLSIWNKDSILSDMVFVIRQFRPDVIICRFPTSGEGGHGHHTASAILALEAFDAADDPNRFPNQLKSVQPWKVKRIFWNTFNFGGTNTTSANQLKMDVGLYNPLLGKSYGEIAAESRSCHKSQGFGSSKQRGSNTEYFKLLKGDSASVDLFEGINTTWGRFKNLEKLPQLINACIDQFNPLAPEKSVSELIKVFKQLQLIDPTSKELSYWKNQKLKEAESLLLACSGLWLEAGTSDYRGVPNHPLSITAQVINRSNTSVKLNSITYLQSDTATALNLNANELYTFKFKKNLLPTYNYSNPYWLNQKHDNGLYSVNSFNLIGKPENVPQAMVTFHLQISDLSLSVDRPLVNKYTDPVKGEVYRPFEILPPVTLNFPEKVFVFANSKLKTIPITITAHAPHISGKLQLKGSPGWKISLKNPEFKLNAIGEEVVLEAEIAADEQALNGKIEAEVRIDSAVYNKSLKRIQYDHIPAQFVLSDAEAGLINLDLKKTNLSIGYIPGAGDDLPACLKQVGYEVTILTNELLANENLSKYKAILTGVRAYNTNEGLQALYPKLMQYIKDGGNLIVQYNTNNRIGPVKEKLGPYPFTISRERVTEENASVQFLNEKHAALNFPNKITEKDFEAWVQERGVYFATELDKQYEPILSMKDTNEKVSDGSLIIGKYGKGNFVYTGLAFFRQLPAGVPGAYRLLVNLLSLPENK